MTFIRSFALIACLLLAACPGSSASKPVTMTACVKAYDKCVLANGVLGICNPVDCPEGQAAPCLVCRSQH